MLYVFSTSESLAKNGSIALGSCGAATCTPATAGAISADMAIATRFLCTGFCRADIVWEAKRT